MHILFRSCEANLSPGSLGKGTDDKPRWNGKYKLEILRKSYLSIQEGLNKEDSIIIVNDRTTKETLEWMKNTTIANFSVVDITSLDVLRKEHKYPKYHPVVINACPDLTELLIQTAESNPEELIYICEDDYLHTPIAISAMKNLYNSSFDGFYVPYDYPDRYTIDREINTKIYLTNYGHIRTVPSATLTIAALGKTWLKYKYEILRAGVFADDSWTWKAFAQIPAFCPIPGHATHLQEGCITPGVDWETVYANY